jgi:hypothetical protein
LLLFSLLAHVNNAPGKSRIALQPTHAQPLPHEDLRYRRHSSACRPDTSTITSLLRVTSLDCSRMILDQERMTLASKTILLSTWHVSVAPNTTPKSVNPSMSWHLTIGGRVCVEEMFYITCPLRGNLCLVCVQEHHDDLLGQKIVFRLLIHVCFEISGRDIHGHAQQRTGSRSIKTYVTCDYNRARLTKNKQIPGAAPSCPPYSCG